MVIDTDLKKRTMLTTPIMWSENVTSWFCNHFKSDIMLSKCVFRVLAPFIQRVDSTVSSGEFH